VAKLFVVALGAGLLSAGAATAQAPASSAFVPGKINTLSDDNGEVLVDRVGGISSSPLTAIPGPTLDVGDYLVGVVGITSFPTSLTDPSTVNQLTAVFATRVSSVTPIAPDWLCFPRLTGLAFTALGACAGFGFEPTGEFNAAVAAAFPTLFSSLGITGFADVGGGSLPPETVALVFEGPPNDFLRSNPGDVDGNGTPNETADAALAAANGTLRMVVGAVAANGNRWTGTGPVWVLDAAAEAALSPTKVSQVGTFSANLTILSQDFPGYSLGPALTLSNGALSGDVNPGVVPWAVTSNMDISFPVQLPEPCLDLEKEVSPDGGATWYDADTEAVAVTLTAGATYRLIVRNCGNVTLTNVVINDAELGIVDYLVGDLAPGQEVIVTEVVVNGVNLLEDPDICQSGPGAYVNTACATAGYNGASLADCDPAWVACVRQFACRVTAGGNKDGVYCPLMNNGEPDPKLCNVELATKDISHTWGGQAGAPPRIDGNWTHKYDDNRTKPSNHFTFHSNDVRWIQCSDPGEFCSPARFAPNRQIDFSGYGTFTNGKGLFSTWAGKTPRCFMVHLEDIGEPGRGGRWPSATQPCTHCPGTAVVSPDCTDCTDYYAIEIYDGELNEATGQCGGTLLWRNGTASANCGAMEAWVAPFAPYEGFFIRAGNVQMHPDNNGP
jgi:hypothetical protein